MSTEVADLICAKCSTRYRSKLRRGEATKSCPKCGSKETK